MVGVVNIYGVIGELDDLAPNEPFTTFLDVVKQVEARKDADSISVVINSPGGWVEEGDQIYNYLKSLEKPVKTIALKECSSIATKIFMAGTEREIHPGTSFMIHNPWGGTEGDADEMEMYASELRSLEKELCSFYSAETGTSKEAIKSLMKRETTLTPEEAVQLGFATSVFSNTGLKAVAYSNKLKTKDNMSTKKEFDTKLEKFMAMVEKVIKGDKKKSLLLQDANGQEIDFPSVMEGEVPAVDDAASIDGKPAEGEFTMPDGTVYVFAGGKVSEIREASGEGEGEGDDELTALKEENERLKAELEASNLAKAEAVSEKEVVLEGVKAMKKEYKKLKKLSGDFTFDTTKKDTKNTASKQGKRSL